LLEKPTTLIASFIIQNQLKHNLIYKEIRGECVRRCMLSEMKDLYWDIIKDFSIGIKQLDTKEVLSAQIKGSYLNDSTYDKIVSKCL